MFLDNLFDNVRRVFEFIYRSIFLQGCSSSEFHLEDDSPDTEILNHFIGRNIAKESCAMISKHYLSKIVPTDVEGLRSFGSIATAAIQFEDDLIAMGENIYCVGNLLVRHI